MSDSTKRGSVPAANPVAVASKAPEAREPMPEQRSKIRELLDKFFDDELGAYAAGYTDQRIAQEAGDLPKVVVAAS